MEALSRNHGETILRHRNFNAFKPWNYDDSKVFYKRTKLIDFDISTNH